MPTDEPRVADSDVRSDVRDHYGRIAAEFSPRSHASCCGPTECGCGCSSEVDETTIDFVSALYENADVDSLPGEVTGLSLGCGDPVTLASLEAGQTVLDLGSGGGIDCFLAAKQVGESGRVIGVDMTAEMIEKARANRAKLGAENVEFRLGEIEHLPVGDATVDVVISNCVINLSPDKPQVFREAFRVLKAGGKLSVSDIVTNGPLPDSIADDSDAWSSCVSGALEAEHYVAAIEEAGFHDVKLAPVNLDEALIEEVLGLEVVEQLERGAQLAAVNLESGGVAMVELAENERQSVGVGRLPIFSAKITAYKPRGR